MTAEQLIQIAIVAVRQIFALTGEVVPLVHFVRRDGTQEVFHFPQQLDDKDKAGQFARFVLKEEDAVAYVMISEAWMFETTDAETSDEELDTIVKKGVEHHPGRKEVVAFSAEDENGTCHGYVPIIRPEGSEPYLGGLEVEPRGGTVEGTFAGMLPIRSRSN